MDILTIIIIAIGLSMDAFAVSITSGCVVKDFKLYQALRMAFFFGGFQFIMPVAGWFGGLGLRNVMSRYDHWIAFGLLAFVGIKMIYESTQMDDKKSCPMDLWPLTMLAVATSIDALAIGVSLSFLNTDIIIPSLLIGSITFVISLAGIYTGRRFGHLFEKKIEIIGGLILIGMGIKILIEHLVH